MIYNNKNQFEEVPAELLHKAEYLLLCVLCPAISDWVQDDELTKGEYSCPRCGQEMEKILVKV